MCGIVVTVDDDRPAGVDADADASLGPRRGEPTSAHRAGPIRVLQVRGDPNHPLSRGYTCPKGRALPQYHHHPHRLDHPRQRQTNCAGGDLDTETSWDGLLGDLATRVGAAVDRHGPSTVAMYLASGSAFDTNGRRAAERFLRVLGSPQRYTATTLDTPSKPLVAELVGGWSGLTPMLDPDGCRLVLFFGSNPVVSHGHSSGLPDPIVRLRAIQARGGEVWVADPRRTETAALATRHLPLRPGTDWLVLGYLVRELLAGPGPGTRPVPGMGPGHGATTGSGLDHAYLDAHTDPGDLDTVAEAVAPFTLDLVTEHTGLAATDLVELLAAVRRHGKVSALTGTGVSMSRTANVTEWLLWLLHIVTGSYDTPGGMWFNPGFFFQMDQRRVTPSDGVPGAGPASRPELPRRFDEYPCAGLVSEIEAGNITALFVVGGNPLMVFPEPDRLAAAFERLDVLAVVDIVETETVAAATHVLPATDQLERADLPWALDAYQPAVVAQYTPAVVSPPAAEHRPVWWMFADLARRMGMPSVLPGDLDPDTATDDDLLSLLAANGRLPLDDLRAAPSAVVVERAVHGWVLAGVLPDGRFRVAPEPLLAQLRDALDALDAVATTVAPGAAPTSPVTLQLIPRRIVRTMNSQMRDVSANGDNGGVRLHPLDAAEHGIGHGDPVRLTNESGTGCGTAVVDENMSRGVISVTHGWAVPNAGSLASSDRDVDPLTGMVMLSGIPVTVTRG